ncbi:hypothetical protein [Mycobacterium marinum]|uniref:hypothetical protein n=1 Tax=Mycobacterium marinum TaxID=1781 RepID=UPI0003211985
MSTPLSQPGTSQQALSDAANAATGGQPQGNGQQQHGGGQGQQSGGTDMGFPAETPVKDMSVEQQLAYYKHQNRQADNKLSAFKGVTPQQVQQMQQQLDEQANAKLSADQKAVKDAEKAARAAADAEWRPKYQASELKSLASQVLKGEQLKSFMAVTDPAKFAGEDGEIDEEKVMGHLTAIFGADGGQGQQPGNGGQQQHQQPSWGQHSGGTGGQIRPGEAGRAEAAKRFKTT